nr:EOG090X07IA [Sida crystallina]
MGISDKLKNGKRLEELNTQPVTLIDLKYLKLSSDKCETGSSVRLLLVVKSAISHGQRRAAIRQTWGYEKRFADVKIRCIFLLGIDPTNPKVQEAIDDEADHYGDIVQSNFVDAYYNNTLKIMSGFRWAVEQCPQAQYVLFSDDDMYISTKNVLRFIRNPSSYPAYLELPVASLTSSDVHQIKQKTNKIEPEVDGESYVFHSPPQRHRTSKWYVPLEEYPFHLWPPYATAGAFIVSRQALLDLYYASFFTRLFRFDDIYLGLVARKAGIDPQHCSEFHYWKKDYSISGYRYVIASHGYHDPDELKRVWNQQKSAGNA